MSKYLDGIRAKNKPKMAKKATRNDLYKKSVSQLDKLIWAECRRIASNTWKDPVSCYTCGRFPISGANKQLSHLIPKGSCGAFLKFDFRNLRFCCYHCNINLGGNGAEFYRRMEQEVGIVALSRLFSDKNKIINAKTHYIERLLEYRKL